MEYVRQILWDQMTVAKERKDAAAKAFDEIMADLPSGLPHPDGSQRIATASAAFRQALNEYTEACRRMNDFVVHGIVPKDLLRSRGQVGDL